MASVSQGGNRQPLAVMKAKLFMGLALGAVALAALALWALRRPASTDPSPGNASRSARLVAQSSRVVPARAGAAVPAASIFSARELRDDNIYRQVDGLRRRGKSLTAGECKGLYQFLKEPFLNIPPHRLAGIENEVLHILRGQANLAAPWDRMLADLVADKSVPHVVRDYGLQHLFNVYEQLRREQPGAAGADDFDRMERVFWSATSETESEMAGTALLGLSSLLSDGMTSNYTASDVASAALGVLGAGEATQLSRLTGLQVCARLGVREALPAATQLASAPRPIPVRCSAIAAVGELGGEPELALLNGLAGESDPAIAVAVNQAVHHLTTRIRSSHL